MSSDFSDYRDSVVKRNADYIRGIIHGGKLCGEPIDENNIDEMIVAAFFSGTASKESWASPVSMLDYVF